MHTIEAGVLYFALLFAAGFVFGAIRTLWVVPFAGVMTAELLETATMLVVTILVVRWIVRHLAAPAAASARLGIGCIALVLLLIAEFGFMLRLRLLTIRQYCASRDPVLGTVYYVMLAVFAAMPLLLR